MSIGKLKEEVKYLADIESPFPVSELFSATAVRNEQNQVQN